MVRSENCAAAGIADISVMATPAASAYFNVFMVISSFLAFFSLCLSSPQPGEGNHHQVGEDNEQDEHDKLCDQEGIHPLDHSSHWNAGDATDHVEHDAHRRRDQPD